MRHSAIVLFSRTAWSERPMESASSWKRLEVEDSNISRVVECLSNLLWHNLSLTGKEPQVCVSHTKKTCCTRQTEASLRIKAAKNIKTQLQTKYMAAKKAMLSLFDDLKGKPSIHSSLNYFVSWWKALYHLLCINKFFRLLECLQLPWDLRFG